MKITRWLSVALLALLLAVPGYSQTDRSKGTGHDTRLFITGIVGPGQLGFRGPRMSLGVEAQQDITKRFSLDVYFNANGDVKTFTNVGHGIHYGGKLNIWVTDKFALHGGMASSTYWSSIDEHIPRVDGWYDIIHYPFKKGGNSPFVGFTVQTKILGGGGYFNADYFIPTGCVWATEKNACPITSAREHAIVVSQDVQIYKNFYFGARGGWINYGDQVNPLASHLMQPRHNTHFGEAIFKYQVK